MRNTNGYVPPTIRTIEATDLVEALGPVSAGSGAGQASTGGKDECTFWDWLWGRC
jgi:hypothetical protein